MSEIRKIFINGKEVDPSQLPQLPDSVRQALVDANGNGIPDIMEKIFENPLVKKAMENAGIHGWEQLPPEKLEMLKKLMGQFGGGAVGAQPQVQAFTTVTQSPPIASASVSGSAPSQEWKSAYSLEEPKSISAKTLFFAMAALFALIIFGFVIWIFARYH